MNLLEVKDSTNIMLCDKCGNHASSAELTSDGDQSAGIQFTCSCGCKTRIELQVKEKKVLEEPQPNRHLRSKVSGVTFANSDGTNRQDLLKYVKAGDTLTVEPGELNGSKVCMLRHAIGIIGTLKSDTVKEFQGKFPGAEMAVSVIRITGGQENQSLGCNIEVQTAGEVSDQPPQTQSFPKQEIFVFLDPDGQNIFHTDQHCSGMKNAKRKPLYYAKNRMQARACKKCAAQYAN